ncbi:MAG: hypothetical protein WCK18_17635 [Prolixibacteraceae bacterium]
MKKSAWYCLIFVFFLSANPGIACTSFLISGKYTPDGKPILFKNRDTDQMNNSLVFFNDGRYRYIGLVDGSKTWDKMVWGGYNETGFAIINTAAYNNNIGDTTKLKDREGVLMKLALQSCQSLEDFEKMLNSLPKPLGVDANFGVIDAMGGAAYYETGNYRFTKFDANDPKVAPEGILIRTNHSFSGDLTKGFGFCRYNTATIALHKALETKNFTPEYLFNNLSRNLYHSLTKTDLTAELPRQMDLPEFKFFTDYIPRISTASAIMIFGAKDKSHAEDAMMWTILGFPLTSVAVPVWIAAGNQLPRVVSMSEELKSPVCAAALKMKEQCFPLTYDNGRNYINLSVVINQQQNGYLQVIQPIEKEIFNQAALLAQGLEKGGKNEQDIRAFYGWMDRYLSKSYAEKLNIQLLDN